MSVRRWMGITGVLLATAAGYVATVRERADPVYEAQVAMQVERVPAMVERTDLFEEPDVRALVRLRLGATPLLRVTASDDHLLVRSRGTTPAEAVLATETYARSYVDIRRRRAEADRAVATEAVQRQVAALESQLAAAVEPQRAAIVAGILMFNQRLDQLQGDLVLPSMVGTTPAAPVGDGAGRAWALAGLGVVVGLGAAASGRGAGRRRAG